MEEDTNTTSPSSGSTVSSSTTAATIPDNQDNKTLPDLPYSLPIDLKDPHPQQNVQMIHYQDDTMIRLCPQQVTKTPKNEHTIKNEHVSDSSKITCDDKYLFIEGIYGFTKHKLPLTQEFESKILSLPFTSATMSAYPDVVMTTHSTISTTCHFLAFESNPCVTSLHATICDSDPDHFTLSC